MLKLINRPLGSIVPAFILFIFFSLTNCSKDPDPEPINQQEVITHVELAVIDPSGGSNRQTATWSDETKKVDKTINLTSGLNYQASLQIWNRSNPSDPEDVTIEVKEEVDEHLVFYEKVGIEIDITSADSDPEDSNGVPLNLNTVWKGSGTGTGNVRITLIHEPTDKSAGTRSSIGGETDFEIDFPVTISAAN